ADTLDISVLSEETFQSYPGRERRPLDSRDPCCQIVPGRGTLVQHGGHPTDNRLSTQIGGLHTVISMVEDVPVDPPGFDTVGEAQGRDACGEGCNSRVCPGPGKERHPADDPLR